MPIQVNNTTFSDVFGNSVGFYRANPGDVHSISLQLKSSIRMSEAGNPFTIDPSLMTITTAGVSWLDEGFRLGDNCIFRKKNAGGGTIGAPWYDVISAISQDGFTADFGNILAAGSIQSGQFLEIYAVVAGGSPVLRKRDDLDVLINHVNNTIPGGAASIIDGEFTRAIFPGVAAMLVGPGNAISGILVGNQSGQFLVNASIERFADSVPDGWAVHILTLTFAQSGVYNPSYFNGGNCLKLFVKLLWASYAGEPFAPAEYLFNDQANTGWFNEAHNSSISNSVLVSGVSEIDYSVPTTFDIIVDGPLTDLGVGSMYESTDIAYYKDRVYSQLNITMARVTTVAAPGVYPSYTNEFGAGYNFTVNSIGTVGTVHTINVTITPNAAFTAFIDGREEGDRLFHVWVKCGNINWLAFSDQLTIAPPVGGPLIMVQDHGYLDHAQNVDTAVGDQTGFVADTEDDVAFVGKFLLEKNVIQQSFTVKIEAYNTVTEEDFTLQQAIFGFGAVQISGDGRYLLDETATITTELPTTSVKREARLTLEPTLDTATEYGVKIYAPWLLNWRYWQALTGVNVDFYPNQNKNWEQYDDPANWVIRTELVLLREGLAYVHDNVIEVKPYDNEVDIDSTIDLIQDATSIVMTVVPVGDLMRIRATHENLIGAWGANTWGMITIEPTENTPRWICSSAVDFDNNSNNPLTPLTGLTIPIQFPASNIAELECYFDTNLINLSNGVKITAKIKDPDTPPLPYEYLIEEPKLAELAFSTKYKLSTPFVYSGPIMRVIRDFDSAESDIPFYGTAINETFLVDFVTNSGANPTASGYIKTLYDQSGWNNHALTSIVADMPAIVKSGVIVVSSNGFIGGLSETTLNNFTLTTPVPALPNFASFHVFDRRLAGTNTVGLTSSGTSPMTIFWTGSNRITDLMGLAANVWSSPASDLSVGNFLFSAYRVSGTNEMRVQRDGVDLPLSPMTVAPAGGFFDKLLQRGTPLFGNEDVFQEIILFNNDQSANVAAINTNIKNRYNIP